MLQMLWGKNSSESHKFQSIRNIGIKGICWQAQRRCFKIEKSNNLNGWYG